MDYRRGLEVVRLNAAAATGVRPPAQDVIALGSLTLAAATAPTGSPTALLLATAAALGLLVPVVGALRVRRRRA